ncbi:PEPxxWA-CTERM sorting domain-containing protein [Glacieibacterium frigidum]|uniref:PEP-CTERM sorting domain-containing protein n=1 Tax=Glacieibacterium frigidum TaxID=2593303 RepID=A0A552U9R3_9SPHN|nr:PEPxxWA-CTERM sorting domain-containing protein [Glacieibacterium frigidum]TRW14961.1 PEP-CTERM sorting domain-containing protein [Glacieibacterium frigidum]
MTVSARTRSIRAALVAAALFVPSLASALTVTGGDTRVAFNAGALTGLTAGVTGGATVTGPGLTVNFPIIGGFLDAALAGQIRHDGSGITLSNGTNTLALGNFVIDTTASILFGDAALNDTTLGTNLALFGFDLTSISVAQLTDLDNPLLGLQLTSTAAGALTAAFGVGDLTGATLGNAATAPAIAAVPEPGTWAMLIIGFGAVGALARRTRARPLQTV